MQPCQTKQVSLHRNTEVSTPKYPGLRIGYTAGFRAYLKLARTIHLSKTTPSLKHFAIAFSITMSLLLGACSEASAMSPILAEKIVDAIYLAEGGERAKKPYGILSVPCDSHTECRRICLNTVRNNYKRWLKDSRGLTYLEFLASRYAPIGVENDPTNLNRHWLSNVQKFLYGGE